MDISPVIHEFHNSWEFGDEYDYSDYQGFLDEREEPYDDWDEWDDEEPLDVVEELRSWSQRAVDEAIEEEEDEDEYPRTDHAHGDW